jgi:hypothetical protein
VVTKLLTRNCECTFTTGTGQGRPKKCECGNHFWTERQLNPPERKPLAPVSKKRQAEEESGARPKRPRKGLKQTQRRETAAEKRAREDFNETVKSYPCWFRATRSCENCGGKGTVTGPLGLHELTDGYPCPACHGDGRHHCRGPKDAHHVLPKRFIRMQFQALLPEKDFVAILFNPAIGAPLCRYGAHESVEKKLDRIYWEDLSEECIEYVGTLPDFVLIELERQCPKRPDLDPSPTNEGSVAAPRGVA